MFRFFVPPSNINDKVIIIEGPDVAHITRVLRLCPGDGVIVLDGKGRAYEARIIAADKERVYCRAEGERPAEGEPRLKVSLAQCVPKGDKMDYIVQRCTELGVYQIFPVYCHRMVVRFSSPDAVVKKRIRWQRIALEAAKQCRRGIVPLLNEPLPLKRAIAEVPDEALFLIVWEGKESLPLRQVLTKYREFKNHIYLLVGPEGGFETEEVKLAETSGALPVTLGPRILRTEAAGQAILTVLMYEWGEMG